MDIVGFIDAILSLDLKALLALVGAWYVGKWLFDKFS